MVSPGEYSWIRSVSSSTRCAPTTIVGGSSAASVQSTISGVRPVFRTHYYNVRVRPQLVVENFTPRVMDQIGLSFDAVKARLEVATCDDVDLMRALRLRALQDVRRFSFRTCGNTWNRPRGRLPNGIYHCQPGRLTTLTFL